MADAKTGFSELFAARRNAVQGAEATLLQRRRIGGLGLVIGLIGAVLQVIVGVVDRGYFKALSDLSKTLGDVIAGTADRTVLIGLIGLVLLGVGLLVYLLLRWTRLLQKESKEPFRYTVSMDPFKCIEGTTPKDVVSKDQAIEGTTPEGVVFTGQERLKLLHYDLRERLDRRIGRFSLLERRPATRSDAAGSATSEDSGSRSSTSHFHITGEYVFRQDRNDHWFIHIMPTVQLGPEGSPLTMAYPIRYDLEPGRSDSRSSKSDLEPGKSQIRNAKDGKQIVEVDATRYEQIVERVYSSVATEVYRKIETDVRTKIEWFPTRHLRAVALFYEAQDMARSNTVDAYDRALDLYRSAQRFFDLALLRNARRWLIKVPVIWQRNARYLQMRARIQIGYVRCQIYRQMIALQSGRKPNPIYECIWRMDEVIEDLQVVHARFINCDSKQPSAKSQILGYFTFQRDRFLRAFMRRPLEADFQRQRQILFDAYTAAALADAYLGNIKRARKRLNEAVAIDPSLRERDPIHLLAEAQISPDLRQRLKLLQEATDLNPSFQIAQYRLAQVVDLLFRDDNELDPDRVANVIRQYGEVLRINPGNIAAIASKGYLYWLTSQLKEAEQCFREGIEFKNIVRETSIAELTYGLARTLAEQDKYTEALDQFTQSVAIDPDVAAWTLEVGAQSLAQGRYYSRMSGAMLRRYAKYARRVERALRQRHNPVHRAVRRFVINDLANAHLNNYFRRGDPKSLSCAEEALLKIEDTTADHPVVHFNLAITYDWKQESEKALRSIDRATKLAPEWQTARLSWINQTLLPSSLEALNNQVQSVEEQLRQLDQELSALDAEQDRLGESAARGQIEEQRLNDRKRQLALKREERDGTQTRLNKLRERLKKSKESYDATLVTGLRDLTRNSRLSHLLDPSPLQAAASQWIDNAVALDSLDSLRWEQLDDFDVLGLRWLAQFTSQRALIDATTQSAVKKQESGLGEQSRKSLEGCIRLNRFLTRRFLAEDLDLCLVRKKLQTALGQTADPEIIRIVEGIVTFWLEEDLWHYWVLKFWVGFLELERLIVICERQLHSRSFDSRLLSLVVDQLLDRMAASPNALSEGKDEVLERGTKLALQAAEDCVRKAPSRRSNYNLGRVLRLHERWIEAAAKFEAAQKAVPDPDVQPGDLISANLQAHEKVAEALEREGDLTGAFDAYLKLAQIDPSRYIPQQKLSRALGAIPTKIQRTNAAARVRDFVKNALGSSTIADAQRKSLQELLSRVRIGECLGSRGLTRQHVVTPIAIEVASNLVELVAKGESELRSELLAETETLRDRFRSNMGVRVPGLRFRGNQGDLPPGAYIIIMSDIPLVMGTLNPAERFYSGDLDVATRTQLHARAQADPLTNRTGWWLPDEAVKSTGLKSDLVAHPRTFMMRHIEAVLQNNLAEFLGHSELEWMIGELRLPPEREVREPRERSALLIALRSLLFEGVPIVLADIVTAWPEVRATHSHLQAQVEALRSLPSVRSKLPGNDRKHRLFETGPKFESAIRENLRDPDRAPVLGLSPELWKEMLASVRRTLPSELQGNPAALVVNDAALRPHLRELTKLEWPSLPVLATAELADNLMALPRTRIELE